MSSLSMLSSDGTAAAGARKSLMISLISLILALLTGLHFSWASLDQRLATISAVHDIAALDSGMRAHLQTGLPLTEFAGFERISGNLLRVAADVSAVAVRDRAGRLLHQNSRENDRTDFPPFIGQENVVLQDGREIALQVEGNVMRLALPLETSLETAGSLEVELLHPMSQTFDPGYFLVLYLLAIALTCTVGIFLYGVATDGEVLRWRDRTSPLIVFFALALLLTGVFYAILVENRASETAGGIAGSFAARIHQAVDLGISVDDLSGLDQIVAEMRQSDEMISHVALIEGSQVTTSSGLPQNSLLRNVQTLPLTAIYELRPRQIYQRQFQVAVGLESSALVQMGLTHSWPLYLSFLILPCLIWMRQRSSMKDRT